MFHEVNYQGDNKNLDGIGISRKLAGPWLIVKMLNYSGDNMILDKIRLPHRLTGPL